MATLEREFSAHWGVDEVFRYFRDGILAGSQSVTDGGGSVYETEGARFIVRVFERFSLTDRDLGLAEPAAGRPGGRQDPAHRDHRRLRRAGEAMDLWRGGLFEEADEAGRRVRCRPPTTVGERAPSAGGRWHLARGHQRRAA